MQFTIHRWIRIALFNLLLVATLGVILRYKIAFALPWIEQKHLLHAHSHFAFSGWLSQLLMVLLVGSLSRKTNTPVYKRYHWILMSNLLTAYGMLISFSIQGYGFYSILFSTASVFVSFVFGIRYWKDINRLPKTEISHQWFKVSLFLNMLSSIGTFALAGMMVLKIFNLNWYLESVYFYLHFQYNGWFFFACMGLLTEKISDKLLSEKALRSIFRFFTLAVFPAYLLSVLWIHFPLWLYCIIVLSAIIQVCCWGWYMALIKKQWPLVKQVFAQRASRIFILPAIALTIKLLLQLGSVIPSLSDLSYGFRPIIIGYLHLVLLGIITLFLLGYIIIENHISMYKLTITGIVLFTGGIIINEILLMLQGVSAMNYFSIPYMNELLFATALLMWTGVLITVAGEKIKKDNCVQS